MNDKHTRTDEQWRAQLTPQQYHITREKGTEPPFSGELGDHKGDGAFVCVCCGQRLFPADTKFDSGSGWPSFYQPADDECVTTASDDSHGMCRSEVLCSRCDAHLGHLFDDGPPPTGLRYCINSAALRFAPKTE